MSSEPPTYVLSSTFTAMRDERDALLDRIRELELGTTTRHVAHRIRMARQVALSLSRKRAGYLARIVALEAANTTLASKLLHAESRIGSSCPTCETRARVVEKMVESSRRGNAKLSLANARILELEVQVEGLKEQLDNG